MEKSKVIKPVGANTEQPGSRSEQPGSRSEQPGSRSEQPWSRSEQPGSRSEQPGSRSEQPGSRSEQPRAAPAFEAEIVGKSVNAQLSLAAANAIKTATIALTVGGHTITAVKIKDIQSIISYIIRAEDVMGSLAYYMSDDHTIVVENGLDFMRNISIIYSYSAC